MKDGEGRAAAPRTVDEGGRTGFDMSSGAQDASELITSSDSNGSDKPMGVERKTSMEDAAGSTLQRKCKRREPTQESVADRPRRYIKPIERLTASPSPHDYSARSSSVGRRCVHNLGCRPNS
jgi:hypothetical protein